MSRFIAPLALLVALVSLALNIFLLMKLNQARVGAITALDRASQEIGGLADLSFRYTVKVNQIIPIAGELPFNQELVIPINANVPIVTTLHTSISTLFGPVDVPVNINTTFPVSLTVPVSISRTVPYSITVPLDLNVPLEIRLRDLGVESGINQARQEILQLRGSLQ